MFTYTHSTRELLTVKVLHFGGGGTVTSRPSGVHCSHTCSHRFAHGATVTLTAKPANGAAFNGWGGACHGTGKCTVRMKSAKLVKARFVQPG